MRSRRMHTCLLLALAAVCALGPGCAAVPLLLAPGFVPQLPPAGLDLRQALLEADPSAPHLTLDGSAGAASGARVGLAAGVGVGAVGGTAACLATGPLAPLCMLTLMPLAVVVGAVGGGAAGAVAGSVSASPRGDGVAEAEARHALLSATFGDGRYQALLAEQVRAAAHAGHGIDFLPQPAGPEPGAPDWRVEVSLLEVASTGSAPEKPYALRLRGRLQLLRAGDARPAYTTSAVVATGHALTTAQWAEGDAAVLRADLDQALHDVAAGLVDAFASYAARGEWRRAPAASQPAGA